MNTSKTSTWFEVKIKYDKVMDDGLMKSVREAYTVEAMSFTEAEAVITKEMTPYMSGEWAVVEEKIAPYKDVLFSENEKDDTFYKVKMQLITLDEKTSKEKRTTIYYLVQASSVKSARRAMSDFFDVTTIDYELVSVSKTVILEVFQHNV